MNTFKPTDSSLPERILKGWQHFFINWYHPSPTLKVVQVTHGPVAWGRRGFHCRSDGRKTCKFAQTFRRVTSLLAPNRSLGAGDFFLLFGVF